MSINNSDLKQLAAEYQQVTASLAEVGERVKAFHGECRADIRNLEREMTRGRTEGGAPLHGGAGAGFEVLEQLGGSPVLAQLAASGRGAPAAAHVKMPLKNSLGTAGQNTPGGGTIPSNPERSGIYVGPARALTLLDVLPSRATTRDSVEHVRLTAPLPAGVQPRQGAEKAAIEADGELVRSEIATIAAHTTASRQVLNDHEGLRAAIDGLLVNKVRAALESQIVLGNSANDGEFDGLVKLAAAFTPTGTPGLVDGLGQLVSAMQGEGFAPSVILLNAADWHSVVAVAKDGEGRYMFGNPASPLAPSLWNVPAVLTPTVAAGSALVLDTSYITLLDRESVQVLVSEHHKDNFTKNLVTVLAELRAGLEVRHARAVRRWQFD